MRSDEAEIEIYGTVTKYFTFYELSFNGGTAPVFPSLYPLIYITS